LCGSLTAGKHCQVTRVYNGHQTKLPRHYVARQKLCLRATSDYWVNAMDGQPFFVVHQAVDPGMIKVIEQKILPCLEHDVPDQPSKAELASDPLCHRFTLVFDREGYSPAFLARMKAQRIACITYHKYPGDDWSEEEFNPCTVEMPNGQKVEMKLAERGSCLSNKLWVREIRKLPCSLDGRRKTSSSMPVNTTILTAWWTIAPKRFPTPYRS
jgi:hypothetical protein